MATTETDLTIQQLVDQSYQNSADHGFWDGPDVPERIPSKLMLIVSEIAEALESYRDSAADDLIKVPSDVVRDILLDDGQAHDASIDVLTGIYEKWQAKPKGFDTELADAFIRLGDLCGALGIDIEAAITRKHEYNKDRPRMHGRKV